MPGLLWRNDDGSQWQLLSKLKDMSQCWWRVSTMTRCRGRVHWWRANILSVVPAIYAVSFLNSSTGALWQMKKKKKTNFHNSWVFTFFWPWKSSCWVWGKTFLQASKPKLCNSNLHCHIDVQPGAAPLTMITGRNKLFSFVSDSADSSLIRSELS